MKKKKLILFVAFAASITFSGALQAQVTIGSNATPDGNAILDLKNTADANASTKGLLLPRVELDSTELATPLTAHVKGMAVYNTKTSKDVTPGYYYNNGAKWVRIADAAMLTPEPWYNVATHAGATANTQDIYQMGRVGIRTDKPLGKAGLHVSERKDPSSATADYYNGILIQRYTETERDANFSLSAAENGLTIFNTTTGCYNMWIWNTATSTGAWTPLCGEKLGVVEFSDCSTIKVIGKYLSDQSLNEQTVHIDVPVKVTALGTYSYTTNVVNGVQFSAVGVFTQLGIQTISLRPSKISGTPSVGPHIYAVTIGSTTSGNVVCNNVSVEFTNRSTSTMRILNFYNNSDGDDISGGGHVPMDNVGFWLTGTNTIGAATTALSYSGTAAIQIVNADAGDPSLAQLQGHLTSGVSVIFAGALSKSESGAANLIKEWKERTGGVVIALADKGLEAGLTDMLGYYLDEGNTSSGVVTNATTYPEFFGAGKPFPSIGEGLNIGYDGTACGSISSNQGGPFIFSGANSAGYADLLNRVVIFGDHFGDDSDAQAINFSRLLVNVFSWAIKVAPIP